MDSSGNGAAKKYLGIYRGTVVKTTDPEQRGRIMALVPDVSKTIPLSWALPCVPVAGIQMGMFTVPPVGSGVWIEFEQGDPDHPVWVGGFWGTAVEVPALARLVKSELPSITLQTPLQNGIVVSDTPGPTGGIQIKTASGAMISVSDVGITITNGKGATITLTGNAVDINLGALTVQ